MKKVAWVLSNHLSLLLCTAWSVAACGSADADDALREHPPTNPSGKADCEHCDEDAVPRIGLTDTLYPQLGAIVEKLGGEPVKLVDESRMNSYFTIPSPFETEGKPLTIGSEGLDLGGHLLTLWTVAEYEESKDFEDYISQGRHGESVTDPRFLESLIDMDVVQEVVSGLDGLLVGGGQDVNPLWYTNNKHEDLGSLHNTRDVIELAFIGEALRQKKPVMGICRGSQILAVALGASLIQDIPSHYPALGNRHSAETEIGKSEGHDILVRRQTTLHTILKVPGDTGCMTDAECAPQVCAWNGDGYCCRSGGFEGDPCIKDRDCNDPTQVCSWNGERFFCTYPACGDDGSENPSAEWDMINVNSYHHQAVDPSGIEDLIEVGAVDANDDHELYEVIEGWVAKREAFVLGVQWHPERPRLEEGDTETKAMFIEDSPERERLLADPSRPHDRAAFEAFMTCVRDADTCRSAGYTYE